MLMCYERFSCLQLVICRHTLVNLNIRVEIQDRSYDDSHTDLTNNLKFPFQTFFILFENFDVIIYKSDRSQPNCCHQHGKYIHVVQFCK
ncbi:hypothetical protein D3C80_1262770 [compost metagenome]